MEGNLLGFDFCLVAPDFGTDWRLGRGIVEATEYGAALLERNLVLPKAVRNFCRQDFGMHL